VVPRLEVLEGRCCPSLSGDVGQLAVDAVSKSPAVVRIELQHVIGEVQAATSSPRFSSYDTLPVKSGLSGNDLQGDLRVLLADYQAALAMVGHRGAQRAISLMRAERVAYIREIRTDVHKFTAHAITLRPLDSPPPPAGTETVSVVTWQAMPTETVVDFQPPLRTAILGTWTPSDGTGTTYVWMSTNTDVLPGTDPLPPMDPPVLTTDDGVGTNGCDENGPQAYAPPVVAVSDGAGNSWHADSVIQRYADGTIASAWYNPDYPPS
jgi:hypothetical protein